MSKSGEKPKTVRFDRALVIRNPTSGRGSGHGEKNLFDRACKTLTEHGVNPTVIETKAAGDARKIARERAVEFDVVVPAGGDGTVNEVVNGLCELPGPKPPVGLLPLGTSNSAAREFRIPLNAVRAAEVIARGNTHPCDLGLIQKSDGTRRWFFLAAGAGFAAEAVHAVHRKRTKRKRAESSRTGGTSVFEYVRQYAEGLVRYPFPPIEVKADGVELGEARLVTVCNMSVYGGYMKPVPETRCDDGLLDAVILRGLGGMSTLLLTLGAVFRKARLVPGVEVRQVREIELGSRFAVPFQVDGDPFGTLPCSIRVVPKAVEFVVPE